MYRFFLLFVGLIVAGCSPFAAAPEFAGPIQPEFERQSVEVEIVWTSTEEIRTALESHVIDSGLEIATPDQGKWYGVANAHGDKCYILAARPEDANDWPRFAILGHELAHCLWGDWHEGGKLPLSQAEQARSMVRDAERNPILKDALDRALRGER